MSDPRENQSIFTRGAVDLSALRRPANPSGPATQAAPPGGQAQGGEPSGGRAAGADPVGGGGPGGSGPGGSGPGGVVMVDVTEATFQSEVLERSLHTPVVIDFWAEWCGPCRQLSPVLEKLAVEYGGAWVLAKIDVDTNPRIAQMFRVQGIPMVYAVVGGQPVDAFTGVVPEPQLRQWLDAVLKAAGQEVAKPEDPRLVEADQALVAGDLDAAERAYQKILAESPAETAAEAGLAHVRLARRVDGVDPATVVRAADEAPDDIDAQLRAADVEVYRGDAADGYARLTGLVRRTAPAERERIREHLLSLFAVASPDDPAVAKARRDLANALF